MSTTMVSTLSGGGVPFKPIMEDTKQPAQPQCPEYPPSVPAVLPASNVRPGRADSYLHRQSTGLGVTLIIVGILAVIFNGVGLAVPDRVAPVSHGFWCGAMFIVTGSFGVAAKNKSKCLIVTFMILAIISATMTLALLTVGLIGVSVNRDECRNKDYGYSACPNEGTSDAACCAYVSYTPPCPRAAIAMEALLAVLSVVAAFVSIWGSAICCRAVCCCSSRPTIHDVMMPTQYANHPFVYVDQQQQQQQHQSGAIFITGNQIMSGPPSYTVGATMYQPPMQYWATFPNQPQSQGHVFATMHPYNNDGQVSTASGMLMSPPCYNVVANPSAPTSQI